MQTSTHYKSLDYEFGTLIQSYRHKAKLTQPELAEMVGVSKRSVLNWEAGISYPQINHLRKVLEIFLNKGCFTLHEEASEAEFFWEKATRTKNDAKDAFNQGWFNSLLNEQAVPVRPLSIHQPRHFQDWSEAADNRVLYGRERELAELETWLIKDKQQVVSIFGIGGMGKTSLAVSLTHQVASHFEFVIFRTLRNAPPLDELLDGILRFFLQGHLTRLPTLQGEKLALVMNCLRQHRCLVVLDNFESIMQSKLGAGEYREGYTDYAEFIRRVSDFTHKSCVLITSREKPQLLGFYEEKNSTVRSLALRGLDKKSCQAILKSMNIGSAEEYGQALTERYGGNPLALMLIAEPIRRIYGGHTGAFLASPGSRSGGVRYVLDQHFERLSEVELDILYWLALSREPLDLETIQARSVLQAGPKTFSDGLTALMSRFLVEQTEDGSGFTLQGVIIEYVTENLISRFYDELMAQTSELVLLCRYPLLQTHSREYIRQAQLRLIIDPLLSQLDITLKRTDLVTRHLKGLLEVVGQLPQPKQAYAGGNLLNMLVRLGSDLTGWSFENLSLWQAHLAGIELHGLNLKGADLTGATFTEAQISVYSLAYSPDGKTVAAGCFNGSIKVWETGKMFGRQLLECRGHTNSVVSVTFSPDGRLLASGSIDGTVRLWELKSGLCVAVLEGPTATIRSVAFSLDGKYLAGGGDDHHIHLWQVSNAHLITSIAAEQGWIMALAFSPNGKTLASAGFDSTLKLWDFSKISVPGFREEPGEAKETQPVAVLREHTQWVYSIAFSLDGKLLASGGGDQTIRLWSVATGSCQHILKTPSGVIKVTFSPDGMLLASSDRDGFINLWAAANPTTPRVLSTGKGSIVDLVFNPDGDTFVTSAPEVSNLSLWSVKSLETLDVLRGFTNTVYSVAYSPNGKWLGATGIDYHLHLWNLTGTQPGEPVVLKGHNGLTMGLAFNRDGNFAATSGTDATIKLWNLESKKCWRTLAGSSTPNIALVFSPDNRFLIVGDNEGNLTMWSLVTGEILGRQQAFHGILRKLLFSPDGQTLATATEDGYIRLWEVDAEKAVMHQKAAWHNGSELVMALAYNQDGSMLFSGDAQGMVRCWNPATGKLLASFKAHKDMIWSLEYNLSRQTLMSAGGNGLIHLWKVENPQSPVLLCTLDHGVKLMSVTFNPEGTRLYSGGSGGTVKVWDLEMENPGLVTTLVPPVPYKGLEISGVTGLTEAQRLNLLSLGAVENPE